MTKVLMTVGLPSDQSHEQSENIEFANSIRCYSDPFTANATDPFGLQHELSPNFGDGLRVQAAAVWAFEDAGLAATSIPSVNLTP